MAPRLGHCLPAAHLQALPASALISVVMADLVDVADLVDLRQEDLVDLRLVAPLREDLVGRDRVDPLREDRVDRDRVDLVGLRLVDLVVPKVARHTEPLKIHLPPRRRMAAVRRLKEASRSDGATAIY